MRRALLPALLLGALFLCASTAAAADRYATASSTRETGDCAMFVPCTLPYAATVAQAGDTVRIGDGTYHLSTDLQPTQGVSLTGGTGARPLLVMDGSSSVSLVGANPEKPGRIDHVEIHGRLGLSFNAVGDDLVIRNVDRAVRLGTASLLRNSLVVTSSGSGVEARQSDAYRDPAVVLNSTLIAGGSNAYGAIAAGDVAENDGNCSLIVPAHLILKNVIARGGKADLRVEGRRRTNVHGFECDGSGRLEVSSSNFRTMEVDETDASLELGAGNQTSAALTDDAAIFADTDLFRQKAAAPTRDAGFADALVGPHDLDGDDRVQEAGIDIGADELPTPPAVETRAATDVEQTAATLQALVTPNASATTVVFEYGPTTGYGMRTAEQVLPAGSAATAVQARITGLSTGTRFHYRVLAFNADSHQPRSATGADTFFATSQPPPVVDQPRPLARVIGSLSARRALKLSRVRRKGITVKFTLGRAANVFDLRLTAKLGGRRVTLARKLGSAGAGTHTAKLKLSRKARKRLMGRKRVKAKLVLAVKPADGAAASREMIVTVAR